MDKYTRALRNSLLEEELGDLPDQDADRSALRNNVDDTGSDGQYDIEGSGVSSHETAYAIKNNAEGWARKTSDMTNWLNTTGGSALQSKVQQAGQHPGFEGIGKRTEKMIDKAASVLAQLEQTFNTFINTADSKIAAAKSNESFSQRDKSNEVLAEAKTLDDLQPINLNAAAFKGEGWQSIIEQLQLTQEKLSSDTIIRDRVVYLRDRTDDYKSFPDGYQRYATLATVDAITQMASKVRLSRS